MKALIAFFICFASHAQDADMGMWRIGLNLNLIGQQDVSRHGYEWDPGFGAEVGFELAPWTFGVQWRRVTATSEAGNYSVDAMADRVLVLVRHHWEGEQRWLSWVQGNVGSEIVSVETKLGAETDVGQSDPELVIGGGVGFGWPISPDWRTEILGQVHKTQTRSLLETSASASLIRLF